MKKLILIFIVHLCINAFPQKVENVLFEQAGKLVKINYDLTEAQESKFFYVKIHYSLDGGSTFSNPLKNVTGDVGNEIIGGLNKQIIWDALKDVDEIRGNNIVFEVIAKLITSETENLREINLTEMDNYFALIIGIDDYLGDYNPLSNSVIDAESIERILKSKYKFDNFVTLYNRQATRGNILNAFKELSNT